jgi:5'(3')-deoxyribonucleotidase
MSERTVLVDMDDVLADFRAGVLSRLNLHHPEINTDIEFVDFFIAKDFHGQEALVQSISDEIGFFEALDVIEGAKDGWEQIVAEGFKPIVCTTPLKTHPYCEQEKRNWLEEHFGIQIAGEAIMTQDKTIHSGIALIDDKPVITGSATPTWQQIMFTQPPNERFHSDFRLDGWGDERLVRYLRQLGAKALL